MPRPPSYAEPDQRVAFAVWLEEQRRKAGVSKSSLARTLRHDTTQQVNKFFRGSALPMPRTLRTIAVALGVSWTEAFANAGYYREILHALADLQRLSQRWLDEDKAFLDSDDATFRGFGVVRLNGRFIGEALREPYCESRYVTMFWEEPPVGEAEPVEHSAEVSGPRTYCTVPKPLAAAILIAVAAFPRRGDVYKDGASPYGANVLSTATALIEHAQASTRRRGLPHLLALADNALKDRKLPLDLKRIIAAEYTVAWADSECQLFTHMARLGTLAYFGVAGSSESTMQYSDMYWPHFRRATLPDPNVFLTYETSKNKLTKI